MSGGGGLGALKVTIGRDRRDSVRVRGVGLGVLFRWCRVAQPPVTGRHPCRSAGVWWYRDRWCRSWTRSTTGSYEGCQAAGSASDSGGEGRRSPCGVFRFPRGSLTRSCFLYFLTMPKQRLLPGAFFACGVFASFFRCASGRGMVSLSARQPFTFRASSSYPYADSQSGYIMGYPSPIQAGASGSIYVANFVTGGPVSLFKPVGERAPLHS